MFGLDGWLAHFSDGGTVGLVALVAILLGLRHATDPDHLAAVATLIVSGREHGARAAARLGLAWGAGHATTLFVFALPIVLFKAFLPEPVQRGAETTVGLVIVLLALWLLVRWRRGLFHLHVHSHDGSLHAHGHVHPAAPHGHRPVRARSPLQAYAVGLLHGMGGSAGIGALMLASIRDRPLAVGSLALFALFTAVSMALLSTGFGATLANGFVRRSFIWIAPLLGLATLAFGVWYALAALSLAPALF
jgi:high-affinity nickel permease